MIECVLSKIACTKYQPYHTPITDYTYTPLPYPMVWTLWVVVYTRLGHKYKNSVSEGRVEEEGILLETCVEVPPLFLYVVDLFSVIAPQSVAM